MDKKFKTILIILLIVAIIGIVAYFVLKNNNEDENSSSENSDAEEIPVDTTNSGNSGSISFFEKPNSHLYPIKKGVINSEVKLFQKGLIRAFGNNSLQGGADGAWGPNTETLVTSMLRVNVFKERGDWVALLNKVKGVPINLKTIGKYRTHYLFPKA